MVVASVYKTGQQQKLSLCMCALYNI